MKTITINQLLKWNPCSEYDSIEKLLKITKDKESLTPLEISKLRIPYEDRIWVLLRPEILGKKNFKEIVYKIADRAVKKHCLECGIKEVKIWAEKWLKGDRDRDAADARAAAHAYAAYAADAADAAADNAAHAAYDAARAAYDAARAAAHAAYDAYAADAAYAAYAAADNTAHAAYDAARAAYDAADAAADNAAHAAYAADARAAAHAYAADATERKWQLNLIKKYL